MDTVRTGLESGQVEDGMTGNRTFAAEQLSDWGKLYAGCGGFEGSAEAVASAISQLPPIVIKGKRLDEEVASKLPTWAPIQEVEEELSGWSSQSGIGAYGNRLAGMREPWTADDPEVIRIRAEILKSGKPIPPPDEQLMKKIREDDEIERSGNLVTRDGIPFPVGKGQINFFVEIRWPYVRDELLVFASHRKELSISHDCLEALLTYSPRIHAENLIQLQMHHPALFWAVWRRDFKAMRRILWKVDREQLEEWLVSARKLKKRDLQGERRINEKRIRGPLSDPALRLKCGTALLSEFERLCEILACLHLRCMVTREGIKQFLKVSTSIKDVVQSSKPLAIYLAGSAAQIRGSHPSMNGYHNSKHSDPDLASIDQIFEKTTAYTSDNPRLSMPFRRKPAIYFIGIEQELIPLVAVIMLIENMKRIEGDYRHRREKGASGRIVIENEAVRLAAVIAAHVHTRWARALLNSLSKAETNKDWLEAGMPGKPPLEPKKEGLKKLEEIERPPVGDRNHTRLYARARERAEQLPKVFEPGWSRGFCFTAWMMGIPEKSFFTKCATLQRFSEEGRIAHDRQMKKTAAAPLDGFSGAADTTWTGLPRENPVETQHNRMRPFINQIQVPDKIPPRFRKAFNRERDIFVAEVAKVFPAVTPFTLDPHLHDQITVPIDERLIEFAVEAAWHTTFNPSARGPKLS
ncbi:hypothetical protein [Porphyrobacter sp. YT40]|uniref:hypothetical protein n=1 Tax=Porphyrobacter sp. YT40 TaxID=2547601 RepID=UPI001141F7A0|nr:hypothetical protein [Porphyrobacter sp. YT40]QDH35121.1 hypothetical protein E2E27_12790 [Porphyrobacter sp. YT40]